VKILPKHAAITLLKQEAPAKVVHVLRTHEKRLTKEAAELFQSALSSILKSIVPQLTDFQWKVSKLPGRMGSIGLRDANAVWEVAYEASQSGIKGKQKELTEALEKEWLKRNVTSATTPNLAVLEENVFAPMPNILEGHFLSDDALTCMLRHRLGWIPDSFSDVRAHKGARHDSVKFLLARIFRAEEHAVRLEPSGMSRGRQRPDLLVYPSSGSKPITADLTIVLSRKESKSALFRAEREKRASYEEMAVANGVLFSPWAITTRGRIGESLARDLGHLCSRPRRAIGEIVTRLWHANSALADRRWW